MNAYRGRPDKQRIERWTRAARWIAQGLGAGAGAVAIVAAGVAMAQCESEPELRVEQRKNGDDIIRVEVHDNFDGTLRQFAACSEHMAEELQRACRRAGWHPSKDCK